MSMRTFRVACAVFLAIALATAALAQTGTDIQLTRAELQQDRQKVVAANLDLTEDESIPFWLMYRDYRVEMAHLGDRLVKLITDYSASRDTLSDVQAGALMDRWVSIQEDELAVRKRYMKKFQKVIPLKKTVRFFQIENKLDAALRYELAGLIPLVH